jgi:hypothetical protein
MTCSSACDINIQIPLLIDHILKSFLEIDAVTFVFHELEGATKIHRAYNDLFNETSSKSTASSEVSELEVC